MPSKTILIFFILITLQTASAYTVLNSYVTDNANQITPEYRQFITDQIIQIEKNTSVEIAVLTVESLNGKTIEAFSIETAQGNGIGKKGKDNGLLITIAKKERKWRIEVGYGLEGTITDAEAKIIGEHYLKPQLVAGNWGKGIYDTIEHINIKLVGEVQQIPAPTTSTTPQTNSNIGIIFIIMLIIAAMIIFNPFGSPPRSFKDREKTKEEKKEYASSYLSSGRSDDTEPLNNDNSYRHSYYSGGHDSSSDDSDSSSSDSGSGGWGGGSFGGGGASGGW